MARRSRPSSATRNAARTEGLRRQAAFEAARLMATGGAHNYRQARQKAGQRLGISNEAGLPRIAEIQAQLREYQRLFRSDEQTQALRQKRAAALHAMAFFEKFRPRVVGGVLAGTADAHSPVCLWLHADDPDAVARFLLDARIPAQQGTRLLRLDRQRQENFPVWEFTAEDIAFELMVLPVQLLRQPPLDADDQPIPTASLAVLRQLIAESDKPPPEH